MQNDPNSVKMVRAGDPGLWFGRGMTGYGEWHLGVYGYKRNPLEFYHTYEVEQEEQVEKLEQLRWLKNGWQMGCSSVYFNGIEINAPEDVDKWHSKNCPKRYTSPIDMGAANVWDELYPDDERKQARFWLLNRYVSSVSGNREKQELAIFKTNEYYNKNYM